ncbi:hypothetical protein K501DRAFT_219991 [Backusella circina FSU 941]|nr:hypothetical protein K501DRAFT_219991 [Backusella circina FSU 941]
MAKKRKEKESTQADTKRQKKKQTSISTFFKASKYQQSTSSSPASTQESATCEELVKDELIKQELKEEEQDVKHVKIETIDETELCSIIERRSVSVEVVDTALGTAESINEKEEVVEEEKALFYSSSIYTDHVVDILNTVLDGEAYLFDKKELDLFDRFKNLDDDAKHLFVRLLLRKHKWILHNKINYENNIHDKDKAIQSLSTHGLIETEGDLIDLNTALHILNRNQLKEITKAMNTDTPPMSRRHDYIASIKKFAQQSSFDLMSRYSDSKEETTMKQLWKLIYSLIGSCVRIKDDAFESFQRLQIIYYRLNVLTGDNHMSASILVKMDKRRYPQYMISRTCDLWASRYEYLQYEEALLTERRFETSLDVIRQSNKADQELIRAIYAECWALCEDKLGLWEMFVEMAEETQSAYYLRRFEAGWIYTRLLHHALDSLSRLQKYNIESIILEKLLKQRVYQLSRRGTWYERLSLIQMTYLVDKSKKTDRLKLKEALQTCIDAVHDQRVHQIHLSSIYKRINRLERKLCIPKREQHDFSYLALKTPNTITIHGERLYQQEIGKKSTWRSNTGAECTVEQVALEYYEKQGYKGFHAENGVITMICTLLFWQVIFAPIPGVFETPYQSAPLDLHSGDFFEARLEIISQVLLEISDGDYLSILKTAYDRECPKNTMCVGINWKYELDDLLEIAECIGPNSLASLCKLLFEEFDQRSSGMPDLCCWNYKEKKCLFSEVKGPGDRLSDTQKLWIETLSGFGIQVEVCHVKV